MRIVINERAVFTKTKSRAQHCVHCGKIVSVGTLCISINNASDKDLAIRKNLLFHVTCVQPFADLVEKTFQTKNAEIFTKCL